MSNLGLTIILALIVMLLVVTALGIGYLLTGKNRLKKGCGMTPKDKDSKECPLCGSDKKCEENNDDSEPNS